MSTRFQAVVGRLEFPWSGWAAITASGDQAVLKGKYSQKWNFHHRLVFPHNEDCKNPDVDPPLLLVVAAPDLTAGLREERRRADLQNVSPGLSYDLFLHSFSPTLWDWSLHKQVQIEVASSATTFPSARAKSSDMREQKMQKEKVNVTSMELVPANVPMVSGAPADPAITSAKIDSFGFRLCFYFKPCCSATERMKVHLVGSSPDRWSWKKSSSDRPSDRSIRCHWML